MKKYRIAPEVKEQILKRIKEEGVSVSQAAKDHGIHEQTIYRWISRKVIGQPSMKEFIKLQKQNKQLLELVGELTVKLSSTQKKK